jgi:protein-tyrosine phosphatase
LYTSRERMGFVDLHSHVLPGLDDGSPSLATSLTMIDGLAAIGFSDVCATPHQKAGQFLPSLDAIASTYAEVKAATTSVTLHLGAENMWDDVFFERSQHGTIPSYDDGDAFLFELRPAEIPLGLTDHIFKLRMAGKLPVMAHPERYQRLWDDDDLVEKLRREVAFVIDLGALGGYHGKKEHKAARRFVEDGIAHAVASDAHTPEDVARAAEAIAWIGKRLGKPAVTRLLDDGPRQILAGELPEP